MIEEVPPPRASKRRKMSTASNQTTAAASTSSQLATAAAAICTPMSSARSLSMSAATESHSSADRFETITSDSNMARNATVPPTEPSRPRECAGIQPTVAIPNDPSLRPRSDSHDSQIIWPPNRVPVELFNLIVESLSRKDIQSMRLVNHEFDAKLAENYFKVVVVPFRPEFEALYGSLNINPTQGGDTQKLSLVIRKKADDASCAEKAAQDGSQTALDNDYLLSSGHRVFQQFGDKMRKFALALELNERDLAFPPLKLNQEIVSAPWGLYRWPIMNYQRYTQLEGLEEMADETGYMKEAFKCLEMVTEIGISCDAGLGWLQGPDINPFSARTGPAVFRPVAYEDSADRVKQTLDGKEKSSLSLSILKQMVLNAGYSPREWPEVVLRLLQDEGREGAITWADRIAPDGKLVHERVPNFEVDEDTSREAIIQHIESVIDSDNQGAVSSATGLRTFGLMPSNLTPAQAEMLLELEWAHRALMQSYRIAVMDNKDAFKTLRQLTIARCPGCHVLTWCDDTFWKTMRSIETFHLGVIPDWREITKDPTGDVSQRRFSPINSLPNVFRLLNNYVGKQENIKNLSFEWVCGGEFAAGKSQRDRYILPAPVISDVNSMVDPQHTFRKDEVLHVPYVRKLSLKNCWLLPHVFLNFFRHISMQSLLETELESVSLTGPLSLTAELSVYPTAQSRPSHWPWPLCAGAEPGLWFEVSRPTANALNAHHGMAPWAANLPHMQTAVALANMGLNGLGTGFWAPQPALGQHNHAASVANNHPAPPVLSSASNPPTDRWRAWSWPHVLSSLGMSRAAVGRHLQNGNGITFQTWKTSMATEHLFSKPFSNVFADREHNQNHQVFNLKSCGYAIIESPNIDNWAIIPGEAVQVLHDPDLLTRLRELDTQMLVCQDGLLAKVLHYMPDDEVRLLRTIFGLNFGWHNLYEPIVARAAIADGNPHPGLARFHGCVHNYPARKLNEDSPRLPSPLTATSALEHPAVTPLD